MTKKLESVNLHFRDRRGALAWLESVGATHLFSDEEGYGAFYTSEWPNITGVVLIPPHGDAVYWEVAGSRYIWNKTNNVLELEGGTQ